VDEARTNNSRARIKTSSSRTKLPVHRKSVVEAVEAVDEVAANRTRTKAHLQGVLIPVPQASNLARLDKLTKVDADRSAVLKMTARARRVAASELAVAAAVETEAQLKAAPNRVKYMASIPESSDRIIRNKATSKHEGQISLYPFSYVTLFVFMFSKFSRGLIAGFQKGTKHVVLKMDGRISGSISFLSSA
jgi:hypothetical protein